MNKLYLIYSSYSEGGEISPGNEGKKHPEYEDTYVYFTPQKLVTEYPDIMSVETIDTYFNPMVGDKVYLVIVRYSTGDTFGTTFGEWKIIGIFKTETESELVRFDIENGTYKGSKPWQGYFERLESVDVFPMTINK